MTREELEARAKTIADAVVGMKPAQWSRIAVAVEKSFTSKCAKVELDDSEAIFELMKQEML